VGADIDLCLMAAVIALRPETDRGREILDELEKRTELRPDPGALAGDGTRRYWLAAEDAEVYVLDPELDKIDPDWRDHVTKWRGN
jgi:hypothetical protein